LFRNVRSELLEQFGGVTVFSQAPATGLWTDAGGETVRDDVVVYEVMTVALDRPWWWGYRRVLEGRFGQEELVVRVQEFERL
jgi:hypothetical protein